MSGTVLGVQALWPRGIGPSTPCAASSPAPRKCLGSPTSWKVGGDAIRLAAVLPLFLGPLPKSANKRAVTLGSAQAACAVVVLLRIVGSL